MSPGKVAAGLGNSAVKLPAWFFFPNDSDRHLQVSDRSLAVTAITDPGMWLPCRDYQSLDRAERQREEEPWSRRNCQVSRQELGREEQQVLGDGLHQPFWEAAPGCITPVTTQVTTQPMVPDSAS